MLTVVNGKYAPGVPLEVFSESRITELAVIAELVIVPVPDESVTVPLAAFPPPFSSSVPGAVLQTTLPFVVNVPVFVIPWQSEIAPELLILKVAELPLSQCSKFAEPPRVPTIRTLVEDEDVVGELKLAPLFPKKYPEFAIPQIVLVPLSTVSGAPAPPRVPIVRICPLVEGVDGEFTTKAEDGR